MENQEIVAEPNLFGCAVEQAATVEQTLSVPAEEPAKERKLVLRSEELRNKLEQKMQEQADLTAQLEQLENGIRAKVRADALGESVYVEKDASNDRRQTGDLRERIRHAEMAVDALEEGIVAALKAEALAEVARLQDRLRVVAEKDTKVLKARFAEAWGEILSVYRALFAVEEELAAAKMALANAFITAHKGEEPDRSARSHLLSDTPCPAITLLDIETIVEDAKYGWANLLGINAPLTLPGSPISGFEYSGQDLTGAVNATVDAAGFGWLKSLNNPAMAAQAVELSVKPR